MKRGQGQDVTPGIGADSNFFGDFFISQEELDGVDPSDVEESEGEDPELNEDTEEEEEKKNLNLMIKTKVMTLIMMKRKKKKKSSLA